MGRQIRIKIDGEKLRAKIAELGYTQKKIDEYLGYKVAMKNFIARNEIPISVRDSLEHKFGIMYKDYALNSRENTCNYCNIDAVVEAFIKAGWRYCPWCGRRFS